MDKYRAHNWHCFGHLERQPYAAIYTTLGCPYHCTFCCIQAPFKSGEKELGLKETANSYRYWSPKQVGDELEKLAGMGVRNIKIADEMFVLNKRHVLGICDEIIARKLDFNIWAYARIDTVKEGMLPKLKQAGFNWLAFGIEAANSRVQADVDKRFDEEDVYDTVAKTKAAGINIIGNFIFGLPEDDDASMQETLDMALRLNCEFANLYSAMAYPGSPLYTMALTQNWELPGQLVGLFAALGRLQAAADQISDLGRSAQVPRRGVPDVLPGARLSRHGPREIRPEDGRPHSPHDGAQTRPPKQSASRRWSPP